MGQRGRVAQGVLRVLVRYPPPASQVPRVPSPAEGLAHQVVHQVRWRLHRPHQRREAASPPWTPMGALLNWYLRLLPAWLQGQVQLRLQVVRGWRVGGPGPAERVQPEAALRRFGLACLHV